MGLEEEKNMTRRTHPTNSQTSQESADLLTRLFRAGNADSLKPETRNFQLREDSSPNSLSSNRYSLVLVPCLLVPQSLSPSVPSHRDPNHGERKFPHFQCVPP